MGLIQECMFAPWKALEQGSDSIGFAFQKNSSRSSVDVKKEAGNGSGVLESNPTGSRNSGACSESDAALFVSKKP
jgi:hypothetical protein